MDLSSASIKSSGHLPNAPHTRLQGRLLLLARVAWIIVALLALSIIIIGLPVYFALLQTTCQNAAACAVNGILMSEDMHALHERGISTETYAVYMVLLTVATSLVWMVVGWLIFWRRSDEGMALFVALLLSPLVRVEASGDARRSCTSDRDITREACRLPGRHIDWPLVLYLSHRTICAKMDTMACNSLYHL